MGPAVENPVSAVYLTFPGSNWEQQLMYTDEGETHKKVISIRK